MKIRFEGLIPPMVTPLDERRRLDKTGVKNMVRHLVDGGVDGIFLLGTTGEGPHLSYAIRRELVKETCRLVKGRVPVLVGITETDLEDGETHQYRKYGYKRIEGSATFAIGEEYGKEFAVVRLPDGYTFADEQSRMSSENDLGMHKVDVKMLKPDAVSFSKIGNKGSNTDATDGTGFSGLTVFRRLPDGSFKQIGSTSQVKD